jgi:hypothetical protein
MKFRLPFILQKAKPVCMISDSRIELQFDVEKPVDLIDLTLAFQAFSRQYKKFIGSYLTEKGIEIQDEDSTRLYVTKIESSCIFAELSWVDNTALFAGLIVLMDNANTISEFLKNLNSYIQHFTGKSPIPEENLPGKKDTNDLKDLLTPVNEAGGGALRYRHVKYDKNGNKRIETDFEYASSEIVLAMRGIDSRIKLLETKSTADQLNVLLSLESIQDKIQKPDTRRTRDYGVIERVCSKPLPIYWASGMDQQKVKNHPGNAFKISLMVDANVESKRGEPKAYHVVKIHDILDE